MNIFIHLILKMLVQPQPIKENYTLYIAAHNNPPTRTAEISPFGFITYKLILIVIFYHL